MTNRRRLRYFVVTAALVMLGCAVQEPPSKWCDWTPADAGDSCSVGEGAFVRYLAPDGTLIYECRVPPGELVQKWLRVHCAFAVDETVPRPAWWAAGGTTEIGNLITQPVSIGTLKPGQSVELEIR